MAGDVETRFPLQLRAEQPDPPHENSRERSEHSSTSRTIPLPVPDQGISTRSDSRDLELGSDFPASPVKDQQVGDLTPRTAAADSQLTVASLKRGRKRNGVKEASYFIRRLFVTMVILCSATFAGYVLVISAPSSALTYFTLIPLSISFAKLAQFFVHCTVGLFLRLCRWEPAIPECPTSEAPVRTAVVMLTYNEDPSFVMSRLAAVYEEMRSHPDAGSFGFFLLSDTRDEETADQEAELVEAFNSMERAQTGLAHSNPLSTAAESNSSPSCGGAGDLEKGEVEKDGEHHLPAWAQTTAHPSGPVIYRRRKLNTNAKVGNLRDFMERWGNDYEAMFVLDSDSLVSADLVMSAARRMALAPEVGIIQATVLPVRAESFFSRALQFLSWNTGRAMAAGAAFFSGDRALFIGHNAAIRITALRDYCELPTLPGKHALSGPIASHDFVESVLMANAGYAVHLMPVDSGSYEELPPSLVDWAKRDFRWCRGNFQHLLLAFRLPGSKISFGGRAQLLGSFLAYALAVLWAMLIVIGILYIWLNGGSSRIVSSPTQWEDEMFSPENLRRAALWMTALFLFVPHTYGTVESLLEPVVEACAGPRNVLKKACGGFGHPLAQLVNTAESVLHAALYSSPLMAFHTTFLFLLVVGRKKFTWNTQNRELTRIPFLEALSAQWPLVILGGLVCTAIFCAVHPTTANALGVGAAHSEDKKSLLLFAIMVAVPAIGLVLAPVVTWLSSFETPQAVRKLDHFRCPGDVAGGDLLESGEKIVRRANRFASVTAGAASSSAGAMTEVQKESASAADASSIQLRERESAEAVWKRTKTPEFGLGLHLELNGGRPRMSPSGTLLVPPQAATLRASRMQVVDSRSTLAVQGEDADEEAGDDDTTPTGTGIGLSGRLPSGSSPTSCVRGEGLEWSRKLGGGSFVDSSNSSSPPSSGTSSVASSPAPPRAYPSPCCTAGAAAGGGGSASASPSLCAASDPSAAVSEALSGTEEQEVSPKSPARKTSASSRVVSFQA
uniref:Glucans biosynthesis glucosyltransferase H n=1 Tax=Chromera velia CCMP2878 TaxID=1169474 RepID=A0A0G4I5P7_9ALVE|eukprot:Cvel_1866.t1-p1 / transcript=Cvel_1866.t1 / gene=Cvel_1866 / organism=Chromera_velia_CCMP2878 / gene_product=Glucans biosynthesis glucosyltransferase H, putative / transcript_product=Glucans biosynthesis glucosyltransferase H, putative / location=Cvel_scaffold69:74197-79294(+) / protein_length=1012 / sequence_SO=supercontig / SO=protein_coding / is_pseudo=false